MNWHEICLLEDSGDFAVVNVGHDDRAGDTVMELKKWSHARGGLEPLLLFNTARKSTET